ncbi:MAG: ParB/RepB/Spo0J family partition protein [Myxococcales bacterium]|nr:ParB/RepB/Spo0J family partition protein [Myxococcales bacterium]
MSKAPSAKTPTKDKRKALGRGLGALLPSTPAASKSASTGGAQTTGSVRTGDKRSYFKAQVEDIYPSPEQPRRRFDEKLLEELAQSIREHGVIQPLIVRERKEGGYYLIAGERRWRASQRAALLEIPIVVQDVSSQESFERAIVENVQRADLNAIEEAMAFQRLVDEFELTQEQIATKVGKERSTVANSLRLLKLPTPVRAMVEDGRIGMGHARALLGLGDATEIETCARAVATGGLSVRATEALIRKQQAPPKTTAPPARKSASVRDVENRLTKSLGAQVSLAERKSGKGGLIEIKYADLDDLDRLLERLLHR